VNRKINRSALLVPARAAPALQRRVQNALRGEHSAGTPLAPGRGTQQVMWLLAGLARGRGVEFIDFFQPRQKDLFSRHAGIYFADDGLHPSAASYRHSFETLLHRAPLRTILQRDMHAQV